MELCVVPVKGCFVCCSFVVFCLSSKHRELHRPCLLGAWAVKGPSHLSNSISNAAAAPYA